MERAGAAGERPTLVSQSRVNCDICAPNWCDAAFTVGANVAANGKVVCSEAVKLKHDPYAL